MGKRFALVMGNHAYPEPCRELAEDASEVAGFLRRRPGFETPIFYNKTAEAVTTKLLELVRRLKDAAAFFFHFASRSLAVGNFILRAAVLRSVMRRVGRRRTGTQTRRFCRTFRAGANSNVGRKRRRRRRAFPCGLTRRVARRERVRR